MAPPAEAGNRRASCGGVGQRGCCLHEEVPSCDSGLVEAIGVGPGAGASCGSVFGVPVFAAGTCYGSAFPANCGRKDQLACTIFQHIPSCGPGLVELIAGTEGSFCREIGSDGFPTHCGHDMQRPCRVLEHIPSCVGDLVEFQGQCRVGDDTFPDDCGDQDERACTLLEHIPSCKSELVELFNFAGAGICRRIGSDGFPTHCGDRGEPACQLTEHIPSCKSNAYEVASPKLPGLANGWCVDEEDFSSEPFRLDRPTDEAPPGPRSIFLMHGLNGDRSAFTFSPLHEPARGFQRYWIDANWSGAEGSDASPVALRIFDDRDAAPLCSKGTRIDGYTFSVPLTSRLFRDALLDRAGCRSPGNPPPPGVEHVTLVAHSMGGVMVRDLVYRHYDELLQAGVRIAEVVTLGSPHRGGGSGIPELFNVQRLTCVAAIFDAAAHQTCLLGNWHAALRAERERRDHGGAPYIDNLDFPGVRWITIAAADAQQPAVPTVFDDDVVAQDNLVAHTSAFGIAADYCFPNVDTEPPPSAITDRSAPNLGQSQSWIEHFWPPQVVDRSNDFLTQPLYDHNPFNKLDVSPMALVTTVPANSAGALTAECHGPGPNPLQPDVPYLAGVHAPDFADPGQQGARFFMRGDGNPHGDIVGGSRYGNASVNYIKTILTHGLRGADVDGDGVVDAADRDRLISKFPGNVPPPAPSAFEPGFDVWSDLDGDGFVTLVDLVMWQDLETAANATGTTCGLLGIEPLLLLGLVGLVGRRRRRGRALRGAALGALACALLFSQAGPAGAAAIVRLEPTDASVGVGDVLMLELRADLSNPVSAFGLDVHWDAAAFDYLSPAVFGLGWVRLSDLVGPSADPYPSLALLNLGAVAIPGPVVGNDLLLVTLSFRAKQEGLHALQLSIDVGDLTEGFALPTPGSFDPVTLIGTSVTVGVPEPAAALLLGLGLVALGGLRRRAAAAPTPTSEASSTTPSPGVESLDR